MRCCVFVDGENFRFSIRDLFQGEFNQADYLPKQAEWGKLFDQIVSKATGGAGFRLRTYWYVVQHFDFYPYRFPDPYEYQNVLRFLREDWDLADELDRLSEPAKQSRAMQMLDNMKKHQQKMRQRFDGWTQVQNGIAGLQKAIEFRRAGSICYNLFGQTFGKEKAVDVNLATDMVILKENYDFAIIVSGDQDYVPAVQHLKDSGKQVVNVAFKTRSGVLLPGGAKRLNHITDWSLEFSYSDLKGYLGINAPTAATVHPTPL
jgi:uncharacterized LabA/DUF88 family protein